MNTKSFHYVSIAALVLMSLNLRAIVTSVSAVLAEIQQGTGMSPTATGVLTSLPCFAFGIIGLLIPLVSKHTGIIPLLTIAMGLLSIGLWTRASAENATSFIVFTAIGLAGIAVANVLLPPFIRTYFPNQVVGLMTTYTVMLGIGTVTSALLAAPLAAAFGWRHALWIWSLFAILAAIATAVLWKITPRKQRNVSSQYLTRAAIHELLRAPKARWLIYFFALQSLNAYAQMGWLAQIIRDQGYSANTAGLMLGVMQFVIIPGGFIAPFLLHRTRHPQALAAFLGLLLLPSYMGILWLPQLMWIWVICITVSNLSFPLALCLIGTSAKTPANTQLLSAMAQGFGYIVAGFGPMLVGVLLAINDSWILPLGFLMLTVPFFAWAGYNVARPGYVEDSVHATD
ncbi:MAG: MFS transporter [Corynebacterium sp.]|nr:MFS transporter [Corynebacterium sp.]